MKILNAIVLILLVGALSFGVYVMWLNFPGESKTYKPFSANTSDYLPKLEGFNASSKIVQFYPNMRYRDKRISYNLGSACTTVKWDNTNRAFGILSERTVLDFYQSEGKPEIEILCSDVSPKSEEKGHFIAGEGGPSEIINTTNFAVIFSGRISLYRDEKCDEPKIAIHEILHSLGFDHYNSTKSILYPTTGCDQQIDEEIIDIINKLYFIDSLPDLLIESITASKTGRYLNFNITISNIGLADSDNAKLTLYSEEKKVGNFTLGNLEIGTKRILSVQNTKLPSRSDIIEFVVESDDSRELDLNNNRAELTLS